MPIKPLTTDELYEYRITNIIKRYLSDNDVKIEDMKPDDLDKAIWNGLEQVGQLLYEDMFQWMSEEDWINKIKEG